MEKNQLHISMGIFFFKFRRKSSIQVFTIFPYLLVLESNFNSLILMYVIFLCRHVGMSPHKSKGIEVTYWKVILDSIDFRCM